jgi:hypothetical protein
MLSPDIGDTNRQGFDVPLPAFPSRKNLEWSDWLPKFRAGVKVPATLLSYRFRVVPVGTPVRTEVVGPFEVQMLPYFFSRELQGERTVNNGSAYFALRYRGQPLPIEGKTSIENDASRRFDKIDNVALLAGPRPALLVHVEDPGGSGFCYLVVDDGAQARVELVAESYNGVTGQFLTSDLAQFHADGGGRVIRDRLDRTTYARAGLYRIGQAVFDTRALTVRQYHPDSAYYDVSSVAPLGLSPDERSFVTWGSSRESDRPPVLLVTDVVADTQFVLPVDPVRMRYSGFEVLDPAWLLHHFEWQRGHDGIDRLVERKHFVPIPFHGVLSVETTGYQSYRWEKASEPLREALLEFLEREFQAERQPADSDAYEKPVLIGGRKLNVAQSGEFGYLSVSTERESSGDSTLVARIGERFDALLATGKYDTLFGP